MMHAYDEQYLDDAMRNLGEAADYAVNACNMSLQKFFDLFVTSGVAARFESGDFTLIAGMSGVELAYKVLEESNIAHNRIKPNYTANRSEAYWTGWALAYYQWFTALSFKEIIQYIPIRDIVDLYWPYHEMDIRQFVDKMNERYKAAKPDTNLKIRRQRNGLSQRELAEATGISIRTIQQYEQRQKNINKAQAESLVVLAQVLYCNVEDLIEKV